MTLLHMLGAPGDGGAETYFVELIRALKSRGYAQAAATRPYPSRDALLRQMSLPVRNLGFTPITTLTSRIGARQFAEKVDAKIILSWMSRAGSVAPPGPWARIGRLGGYYSLKYFKGHDFLVANTPDIRRFIIDNGWPADRVSYIPNFAAARPGVPFDRAVYDTPADAKLLLAMGRLHEDKAHDVSLKALTRIPGAYLWIAGSGPLKDELQELAIKLGVADRVRLIGWHDDAGPLYRAADICVFPSRTEPFGNVIIQAWAHGVPVVTARSIGPSLLIEDGQNGLITPVDDDAAVANAIARIVDEPALAQHLIDQGRACLARDFSQEKVVAQWSALFARYGVTAPS